MLIQDLQKIGLSENESKVYLAALELGPASAQEIAKKAKVPRTTAYSVLESFAKKGISSHFEKDRKQIFYVNGAESLMLLLRQEEEAIKEKKNLLKSFYNELLSLDNGVKSKPTVRFYEGKEGIKTMHQEFINDAPEEALTVFDLDLVREVFSVEESQSQADRRKQKGTKSWAIYNSKDNEDIGNEMTTIAIALSHDFPIDSEITIFDDKVFFIGLKGYLSGVIIESKAIANTMKSLYRMAFKSCKD